MDKQPIDWVASGACAIWQSLVEKAERREYEAQQATKPA